VAWKTTLYSVGKGEVAHSYICRLQKACARKGNVCPHTDVPEVLLIHASESLACQGKCASTRKKDSESLDVYLFQQKRLRNLTLFVGGFFIVFQASMRPGGARRGGRLFKSAEMRLWPATSEPRGPWRSLPAALTSLPRSPNPFSSVLRTIISSHFPVSSKRKLTLNGDRLDDDGLGSSDEDERASNEEKGGFEDDSSPNLGRKRVIRPDRAALSQLLAFDEVREAIRVEEVEIFCSLSPSRGYPEGARDKNAVSLEGSSSSSSASLSVDTVLLAVLLPEEFLVDRGPVFAMVEVDSPVNVGAWGNRTGLTDPSKGGGSVDRGFPIIKLAKPLACGCFCSFNCCAKLPIPRGFPIEEKA